MKLEDARRQAKHEAETHGIQIVVVEDPIGNAEDEDGPFGFFPTRSLPIFITSLKHGGKIIDVVEPAVSQSGRRADLENGLVELFRRDPNLVGRR